MLKINRFTIVLVVTLTLFTFEIFGDIEPQPPSHITQSSIDIVQKVNPYSDDDPLGSDEGASKPTSSTSNIGFIHAFVASLSVILVSEIGDKTFFIAAIMAMRHPRLTVFAGAIGALALMTVLSAFFGMAATIIPRVYTYYISTALFAIFGLKMLKDGWYMSPNEGQEELEEVQMDIRKREDEFIKTHKDESTAKAKKTIIEDLNDNNLTQTSANIYHSTVSLPTSSLTSVHNNKQSRSKSDLSRSITKISIDDDHDDDDINERDELIIASEKKQIIQQQQKTSNEILYSSQTNSFSKGVGGGSGDVIQNSQSGSNMDLKQLNKRLAKEVSASVVVTQDAESGVVKKSKINVAWHLVSRVLMQSFTMTFLAEWGDRSQLTTIILSARENVYGVIVGGILGHSVCTGVAVLGGRMLAQRISVRTVTLIGGAVFLLFAISALFISPDEDEVPTTTSIP